MIRTQHVGFVKDNQPGRAQAVLNIDVVAYQSYKNARAREQQLRQSLESVSAEMQTMQQEMNELRSMVQTLINGKQ